MGRCKGNLMHIHPRSEDTNRYSSYNKIFKPADNKKVFDFGGNRGNLLFFSNNEIKESLYTCLDVSDTSIKEGQLEFPLASWHHFDKWNWAYNHGGQFDLEFPDVDKHQDFIWAYSVFSHTDFEEFLATIKWFMSFKYEKIALSFLDANEWDMKEYFRRNRIAQYGHCLDITEISSKDLFYFIDNEEVLHSALKAPKISSNHFLAFYNPDWLLNKLNYEGINATIERPSPGYVPFLVIKNENN